MGKSYSFEEVKDIFGFYDYTLLDKEYKNNITPMLCSVRTGTKVKLPWGSLDRSKDIIGCGAVVTEPISSDFDFLEVSC